MEYEVDLTYGRISILVIMVSIIYKLGRPLSRLYVAEDRQTLAKIFKECLSVLFKCIPFVCPSAGVDSTK